MKKITKILLLMILFICFPLIAKANSIEKIDMDIYIDKSGTAHVTEVWSANLNEGTEGYKPYYNLGNAKITNFKVSEDDREYSFINWRNTRNSFSNKAYKNGINYVKNGLELCWGISKYGYHDYKLTYDIEGFVAKLKDADMVYWQLIPYELSQKPGSVYIKIYSDNKYSNKLPVWGYGKYGAPTRVYNGYVEMSAKDGLNSDEYMTILIKFDKGTFNTYNSLDNNFKHYLKMANNGAKGYKNENSKGFLDTIWYYFDDLKDTFMLVLGTILLVIVSGLPETRLKVIDERLYFGKDGKTFKGNIPNVREIPFNGDIYRACWIAAHYDINNKISDFFGAILLKLILENKIKIVNKVVAGKFKTKEESVFDLSAKPAFNDELEQEFFNLLYEASEDGILKLKEFKAWCKDYYDDIIKWFNKVIRREKMKLISEGKIKTYEKRTTDSFFSYYVAEPSLKDDAIKLKGFKKFLENFSTMNDKETIEVNIWEYYLVFAQMLGIANKVAKQFKNMHPNMISSDLYKQMFGATKDIDKLSHSSFKITNIRKSYSVISDILFDDNNNYSSGGGGFSSGGGGGGSFGGGGGGGGFR